MKNKDLVNNNFDEKFSPEWWKGFGTTDDIDRQGIEGITEFISSIRQNDIDEFMKMLERIKEELFRVRLDVNVIVCDCGEKYKDSDLDLSVGYLEKSLSDIITHLKSIKEKI